MGARSREESLIGPLRPTAHDRFKARARFRFGVALFLAVLLHLLVVIFPPIFRVERSDWVVPRAPMTSIELMTVVDVPPIPNRITPPAPPVLGRIDLAGEPWLPNLIEVEQAIPSVPEVTIPPLPVEEADELADFEHFMPYMVKPELVNRSEVKRALERNYPRSLLASRIEGSVLIFFWIDETGAVQKYEIRQSSGYAALDEAATRVIPIMKFRPAMDRGNPIKVIVALPIRFEID